MENYVSDSTESKTGIIEQLINKGVSIPCPWGVMIDPSAVIGEGTVIYPCTIIKEGCETGKNCILGPNSVLYKTRVGNNTTLNAVQSEEAVIGNNVTIGPFVHIRPGSVIKDGVKVGNFVEIKNSRIGEKTAVSHLTYVGDSDVGKGVNFGCGTVTVNFNGKEKNRCTIGDNAFIGCNTNLIAPVTIGDRAYTAAGSTITEDVPPDSLAIARARQVVKADWVKKKKPYRSQVGENSEFGIRNSEANECATSGGR